MSYSGAAGARQAREALGAALEALQDAPDVPDDVMQVASNIARAVGALFEAERASSELDGRASVRSALATVSQTLALLVDVRSQHPPIQLATQTLARTMNALYPLTTATLTADPGLRAPVEAVPAPPDRTASTPHAQSPAPARFSGPRRELAAARQPAPAAQRPVPQSPPPGGPATPAPPTDGPAFAAPPAASTASAARPAERPAVPRSIPAPPPPAAPLPDGPRVPVEANIGATTRSNFYVGFSGEVSEGGVFLSTYETLPSGTSVNLTVTLPGGFEFRTPGWVRFAHDPARVGPDVSPGMGIQFEDLPREARTLVLRFLHKRAPLFFDE